MATTNRAKREYVIDTVIFDLGDVLVHDGLFRIHHKYGVNDQELLESHWKKYKVGEISELEYWLGTLKGSRGQGKEVEIARSVREAYKKATPTVLVEYLKRLREAEYTVAILSNHASEWARAAIRALDIGKYCHTVLISGEIGLSKPHEDCFMYALKSVGKGGEYKDDWQHKEVLFIDDRKYNIDAMQKLGASTIWAQVGQTAWADDPILIENALKDYGIMAKDGSIPTAPPRSRKREDLEDHW